MTDDLKAEQVKWLTKLVWVLLLLLSSITAWNSLEINNLPKEYICQDRYNKDMSQLEGHMSTDVERLRTTVKELRIDINTKFDKIYDLLLKDSKNRS